MLETPAKITDPVPAKKFPFPAMVADPAPVMVIKFDPQESVEFVPIPKAASEPLLFVPMAVPAIFIFLESVTVLAFVLVVKLKNPILPVPPIAWAAAPLKVVLFAV